MTKPLKHCHPSKWLTHPPPLKMDEKNLQQDFRHYFSYTLGRDKHCQSVHYPYQALVYAIRDRLMERWKSTRHAYNAADCKRTYYLSMEFLMGRALGNTLLNLGITDTITQSLFDIGLSLEELANAEADAGLGNGGLGRLAACFLDSCASLQLPVKGYGIRYEYGMFRQHIKNQQQVEEPDHWLNKGNPWELERPEHNRRIKFGGHVGTYLDQHGNHHTQWVETQDVLAIAYDVPIPGYQNDTVNTLRLWKAAATDEFNLEEFNAGDYTEAVAEKNNAENITMVLYPNDTSENGKALRLKQQYFLASASLQDVIDHWIQRHGEDFSTFADKNCFQLNDTHPTCVVPELMRLLLDEYHLTWDQAWKITTQTVAYTNHTLLPEALEKWPVSLFERLLPRLLDIIYKINAQFLAEVSLHWPGDHERLRRMSIIEEGHDKQVRMAYLAIVASFSVNGVAKLHSRLLQEGLFHDFFTLWPSKFNNKTNGVTQRRWLAHCNPKLSQFITKTIGNHWVSDLSELSKLKPYANDPDFQKTWFNIKQANKTRLATLIKQDCGIDFDTHALFDVQVKRIHEYKRQLLNVLHVIHLYQHIKAEGGQGVTPRCVLIGGKAAPGYAMAKLIIRLINHVATVIAADPATRGLLQLAFIPNYRVSSMEIICPGTDLSEQISTAGKEASGTGNMKFMMNGAVTIGTLDGANIEIREQVGAENFFLFGLNTREVEQQQQNYNPQAIINNDPRLQNIMQLLSSGYFNQFDPGLFNPIIDTLTSPHDAWMTIADLPAFIEAQEIAAKTYQNREKWLAMSILNTASSGYFSTDRTMQEYNQDIWKLTAINGNNQ